MSKAADVMSRMLNKAMAFAHERKLTADQLNDGGFDLLLTESFELIEHEPFETREELSAQHTKELNEIERKMLFMPYIVLGKEDYGSDSVFLGAYLDMPDYKERHRVVDESDSCYACRVVRQINGTIKEVLELENHFSPM